MERPSERAQGLPDIAGVADGLLWGFEGSPRHDLGGKGLQESSNSDAHSREEAFLLC